MIDYEFYEQIYKGTIVPSSSFDKVINEANNYLNYYCNGQINYDEQINKCICALADAIFENNGFSQRTSESLGSWSIQYQSTPFTNRLNTIIQQYLFGRQEVVRWL